MVHGKKVAPAPVEAPVQPPSQPVAPKLSLPPSFSKSDEVAQDPLKHVIIFLEKRLLNLEKRKVSYNLRFYCKMRCVYVCNIICTILAVIGF